MTRTEMERALRMIARDMRLNQKEADRAILSFQNRMANLRKRGELRPGDDMDMSKGGIFDRSEDGLTLGSDGADAALMSLRAKLVARGGDVMTDDAAERAAAAGVAAAPASRRTPEKPLVDELSKEERDLLRLLVESEARENPDFTPQQAQMAAVARVLNAKAAPSKSATASNAARMESAAPANPKGRGTRSVPISKGSEFGVDRGEFVSRVDMNLQQAKVQAHGTRGDGSGLVAFSAGGREKVLGVPGGRVDKGTTLFYDAVTRRSYISEEMARRARGESKAPRRKVVRSLGDEASDTGGGAAAAPEAGPETVAGQLSLTQLLERFDPTGDGSGDGLGLWRALQEMAEGRDPDLKPTPKSPKAATPAGGLLIIRHRGKGTIRIMGRDQAARGGTLQELLGTSPAEEWDVRYTPADAIPTRDPEGKAAIWEQSAPAPSEPTAAQQRPVTFQEARSVQIELTPEDREVLARIGITKDADDTLSLIELADATHRFEISGWKKVAEVGGPQAVADILEKVYAIQARVNPLGVVLPQQTRAEAIQAFENIMGARSPTETRAGVELLRRLAGTQAPDVRSSRAAGSTLETDYAGGEQFISIGTGNITRPRVMSFFHEVGHWAYWNILTPEDRLTFWRDVASKYVRDGALDQGALARGVAPGVDDRIEVGGKLYRHATNAYDSPQEFFAQQWETWVARKLSGQGGADPLDQALWKKVVAYVEALYDRYVRGVEIDPDLERLFSKILPEEDRLVRSGGVVRDPKTPTGKAIKMRLEQTRWARSALDKAIEDGGPEGIIETYNDVVTKLLLSLTQHSDMGTGIFVGGRTAPVKRLLRIIRQRVDDVNQITTGARTRGEATTSGVDSGQGVSEAMAIAEGLTIVGDRGEVGEQLSRLYRLGYQEGGIVPDDPVVEAMLAAGKIKRRDLTSFRSLLDMLDAELVKAYSVEEGGVPAGTLVRTRPEKTLSPEAADAVKKTLKTAQSKKKRVAKAVDDAARATAAGKGKKVGAAGTKSGSAASGQSGLSADRAVIVDGLRGISDAKLRQAYVAARKAGDGPKTEALATTLVARQQARPVPAKKVELPRNYRDMGRKELEAEFLDALYEGDKARTDRSAYEIMRRHHNKGAKAEGQPLISAIYQKSVDAIGREIDDNMGVPMSVGIPPGAAAQVREVLSHITHREPMVEFALRTMTYRMLNLMGKTVRNRLNEAAIISTEDLARLANVDPSSVSRAAFLDFQADEFRTLRSDLRRMAIALNKGTADPIDLMHEIGHMVMRSGVLSREQRDGVFDMFRAASDPVKERIVRTYSGKYADRIDGPQLLAEEWFAEQLALYMAERTTRGDIFRAAETGDASALRLRGPVDRAIDQVAESVSYVVNGLMGRDDLRQTFRRLTWYGDMFAPKEPPPLGREARIAAHRSYAASFAEDRMMATPRSRMSRVLQYVGRGEGLDPETGRPVVYYHGTSRGDALRQENDPNAILMPSRNGQYGRGVYVTESPVVADTIYANRPTREALERQYEATSNSPDLDPLLEEEIGTLEVFRRNLTLSREEYTLKLFDYDKADEVSRELILEDLDRLRGDIDLLVDAEMAMIDGISRKFNLAYDPLVMPLYVRLTRPADFQRDMTYLADDPFVAAVADQLVEKGLADRAAVDRMTQLILEDQGISGNDLYADLVGLVQDQVGGIAAGRNRLNEELAEMGYDGLLTTHVNVQSLSDDLAADGIAYAAEAAPHKTLVLFDSTQAKHIDASDFDGERPGVYHRQTLPRGTAGNLATEIIENSYDRLLDAGPARVGETAESVGAPPGLSGALMSMMRRRPLNETEHRALLDTSPVGWFRSQAGQMERMGMNWMAKDYREYFPRVHERFGARALPLVKKLGALPDARGSLSGWFYKASGGVGQKAPESHSRITRAIRSGRESRQWKGLSAQERGVAQDVKATFRAIYRDLRAAGVMLGDLGEDYLPHVWRSDFIGRNRAEFLDAMAYYYKLESTSIGREYSQKDANDFAERMYLTLAGDDADGVFIPTGATNSGSRNTTADSIDFNRMLRIEEYPEAMKRLEKFLENDIASLATKYIEAAERRLLFVNKWGVNGHAFHDYLKVAQQGAAGVADLLSKNKEFTRTFRFLNEAGGAEEGVLVREAMMPFEGREAQAQEFAQRLMEAHGAGGGPAVRKMLMDIAPRAATGEVPQTYMRRADAIVGALDDFRGQPSLTGEQELMFATNSMQVLMQKRQLGRSSAGYKFSNSVRNFNNVTLLGFTMLTSLGDVGLPLIRSGSMQDFLKAMKNMASDPEYREMIFNTGVAIESFIHDRMLNMYGGTSDRFNQAFFNATLLTPWTDGNRQLAGAVGFESFRTMAKRAHRHHNPSLPIEQQTRDYKIAARYLRRYGLEEFLPGGLRAGESITPELGRSDEAVRLAVVRFADESVFVPNANDNPLWAQTPMGKIVFQLKSFPLMMMRMSGYVLDEFRGGGDGAKASNPWPLFYLLSVGPGLGMGALAVKDLVQMRGGEDGRESALRERQLEGIAERLGFDPAMHGDVDTFMGWYLEGLLLSGGLGLIGEILYGVAEHAENGAYGQVRIASLIAGPTAGLGFSGINMIGGAQDWLTGATPDSNAKERSGVREFAQRIPIVGGVRNAREGIVDALAGPAPQTGGWAAGRWAAEDGWSAGGWAAR
jgi:hypothetical protein